MTATTPDVQESAPARRFSRRREAVVVVLLAGVVAAWWVTHPRVFEDHGATVTAPAEVGAPIYVGIETMPRDGLVLHGATPRVVFETADAQIDVMLCRLTGVMGVGVVDEEDIAALCEPLRAPVGPVEEGDFLVVEIAGDGSGMVVLDGVDLTYSTGIQRGTQAVGMDVGITVSEP